jgi:hypothetical protein
LSPRRIKRQPSTRRRIIRSVSSEIESAVGIVKHFGVAESGEQRRLLQCIAVGIVAVARGTARAGEHAANSPNLVRIITERLRLRARNKFSLFEIVPRRGSRSVAGLTPARPAPDVRRRHCVAATRRDAGDSNPSAESVITERRLFAGLPRIGNADEPSLTIPGVVSLRFAARLIPSGRRSQLSFPFPSPPALGIPVSVCHIVQDIPHTE